jgi:hypothetical protein
VEFIPKYLAKKFNFFESISVPKFFLLFFGAFFIIAIISTLLGEYISNILAPVFGSLVLICFAAFVSAQHFSRKPWIPSSPLIVQFTSQGWFNSMLSLLSFARHWAVLFFVNIAMIMVLFINVAAIMKANGS